VDEYEELRRSSHAPATVLGFVEYLEAIEAGQAEGDQSGGCVVSTYHGAKGLEWPVVIMADLNKSYVGRMFGVTTVPAPDFDPRDPLANRGIRYWPWPFGSLRKAELLQQLLEATPEHAEIASRQKAESQRLLYVGMTRARDHLVLALRNQSKKGFAKPEDEWLKLLSDEEGAELIEWPSQQGDATLAVGAKNVPIEIRSYDPESEASLSKSKEAAVWRPVVPAVGSDASVPPRCITPSSAEPPGSVVFRAIELDRIGDSLQPETQEAHDQGAEAAETTDLGNALHAVLALAPAFRGRDAQPVDTKIASILDGWGISDLGAPALRKVCTASDSFLRNRYGNAPEYREWPVHLRLPNHQELRGWVDLLLDTPEGWVIIDHKAYRGGQPAEVAAGFGAQLGWYRKALEAFGHKPVRETLIHFPLLGKMFRVEEHKS
jgi:ATP-dependent exoDNAse (exonuclease V) beta subunit